MGFSSLPRYLLASAVALTFGHVAVADDPQCGKHIGKLSVHKGHDNSEDGSSFVGYVKYADVGYTFGLAPKETFAYEPAEFTFQGCKGGDMFTLTCSDTHCDHSKGAMAAVTNSLIDLKGNPAGWVFYNAGPNPDWFPLSTKYPIVESGWFTWGIDDLIRPVTFNYNRSNQEILLNAQYSLPSQSLTYDAPATKGDFWYLTWEDTKFIPAT